ncbi:hypothetical protein MRX96_048856 [Rhipicephalus microplus]
MADEAIVRSHLLDFESGEHNWRGYVKTDQELEHLERALLGLGVSFKVTSSRKHAEENLHKAGKLKLMFSINRGAVPLNLQLPFRVLSLTDKGCLLFLTSCPLVLPAVVSFLPSALQPPPPCLIHLTASKVASAAGSPTQALAQARAWSLRLPFLAVCCSGLPFLPANFKQASCPPLLCSLPRYSWAVDLLPAVGSPWWWNFWWDVKCDHGRPMDSYLREDDITLLDFAPFASPLAAELTLPLGLGQPLSQAGLGL